MRNIKVGFIFFSNIWKGGENYYINLFSAVKQNPFSRIEVVSFVADTCSYEFIERVGKVSQVVIYKASRNKISIIREVINNIKIKKLCKDYHINVLSHYSSYKMFINLPVIAWIPDFQHVRMPHFFSRKQIFLRRAKFYILVKQSKKVILSSLDAKHDFIMNYSKSADKAEVLNFVSQVDIGNLNKNLWREYQQMYSITDQFFYVPNQFWLHKNHKVILDALVILQDKGIECQVVCTGNTSDYRHPKYYNELTNYIKQYNLQKSFNILGEVDEKLVKYLMQKSLAMINPSTFEGWSTTVEEAKTLGKTILLSDIPVHLEQNPKYGYYFAATDANELSELMKAVMFAGTSLSNHFIDTKELESRVINFARQYEHIVLKVYCPC